MKNMMIWMLAAFRLEEKAIEKALKTAIRKKWTANNKIEVKSTGVGIKKSRIMLEKYLEAQKPDMVLITGTAGAVNTKLKAGDVVFPDKVCLVDDTNKIQKILDVQKFSGAGFFKRTGKCRRVYKAPILATVKRTYHIEDKDMLRSMYSDIYAVDMESFSLTDVLIKNKIPFVLFRVISDPYNMKFPKDTFIDALFRLKGIKRIYVFLRHPVSAFRLIMIMPAMLTSLCVLKKCVEVFISSVLKSEAG
ncbi:MAG TPA: hypothetical protein ENN58_03025 [bacterium]|nr:hypothetical protein [bacterium]